MKEKRARKLRLSSSQIRELKKFRNETKNKDEYTRVHTLLLRVQGLRRREIAKQLGITERAIQIWTKKYRKNGVGGIRNKVHKKGGGRITKEHKEQIRQIVLTDPKAFGYLRGRWSNRAIAKHLTEEAGIEISKSHVNRILKELGLILKRPRHDIKISDPNYYRKRKEVKNYKKIAPALEKKGS